MTKLFTIVAILLVLMISCKNSTSEIELENIQMQRLIEEANISVVSKWFNEVNKDNYEILFNELWAKDSKQYFNSSETPVEYNEFKEMVFQLYQEYPIIIHDIHDIIAKDDKVIARVSAKVTHDTLMFGVPATGKELEWYGIVIFQLSEGKIQNRWEVTDLLGMYEQLGMELQYVKDSK